MFTGPFPRSPSTFLCVESLQHLCPSASFISEDLLRIPRRRVFPLVFYFSDAGQCCLCPPTWIDRRDRVICPAVVTYGGVASRRCPGDDVNTISLVGTVFRVFSLWERWRRVCLQWLPEVCPICCSARTSPLLSGLSGWERIECTKAYVCLCRKHDQAVATACFGVWAVMPHTLSIGCVYTL